MDQHKSLYKDQRSHTPRQHCSINRKLQEDNRTKKRRERFQNTRNMYLSPERKVEEKVISICTGYKENKDEVNANTTRLAKIVCNAKDPEKLTKQETFIKRFIEWKEAKKNATFPGKKKPFSSCANSNRQTTASSCLVPRGHHKEFRPPAGLPAVQVNKVCF